MDRNHKIFSLIKTTANEYLPDADVMLFGSRARAESNEESDFDILLITNHEISAKNKIPLRTKIRKDLLNKGIRSDILIQSKKEIDKKRQLPGHIIKNILDEAVPI